MARGLATVRVSKVSLLEALQRNRALHIEQAAEALVDFKIRLLDDLKKAVKLVNSTENVKDLQRFALHVPFPQDYTKEYDNVIEMVEMSLDDEFELDQQQFKSYFKNEWNWSHQFNVSNTMYKTASFLSA